VAIDELLLAAETSTPSRHRRRWVWVLRRLGLGIVVLFLVSLVVFFATQALPADPAEAILGKNATPERLDALRAELGLNEPIVEQYLSWIGGVVHGDFGTSLATRTSVTDLLDGRLVNSLVLLVLTAGIAIPVSIALGSYAGIRSGSRGDRAVLTTGFVLNAIPEFVIGMVLIILLSTTVFHLLPAVSLIPDGESPLKHPKELVLPVLTLVIATVPYLYRLVRASMMDVLASDYIQMARLKGVPTSLVVRRHALPNALVPTIQASALVMAYLLSGTVVIEYLFRYPGLGSSLSEAINNRDLPVIQAIVLIFATGVVLFNLVADIMTVLVTPRLRESSG
jgi:peptide/nickel transport system permease protein